MPILTHLHVILSAKREESKKMNDEITSDRIEQKNETTSVRFDQKKGRLMIKGRMYCLDNVLKTGECTESHYLLVADGEAGYEISFGRNRNLNVSSEYSVCNR